MNDKQLEERAPTHQRVWDPVVRLTHWAIVVSVTAGYLIGENMTFANIGWHFYCGYATGALIALRLLWGLVGPKPARLASLIASPKSTIDYASTVLERKPSYWPGHNPMGGLSALALWAVLLGMVITGLLSESDDFFSTGPLGGYVSASTRLTMTAWHDTLHSFVVPLIALHLAAVLFYWLWKRENLVRPMITGWKWVVRQK